MKFLVNKIKYSIEQEDIDNYREDAEINNDVTDEKVKEVMQDLLPAHLVIELDDTINEDEIEEALCEAISDLTGWCIETFNYIKEE